jgi:Mn2+/Fe2+ NRAMP family transporter
MKALIVIALAVVLVVLAVAGVAMLRSKRDAQQADSRMAHALALRVALSIALFVFVLFSWHMGWIKPSGLPLSR